MERNNRAEKTTERQKERPVFLLFFNVPMCIVHVITETQVESIRSTTACYFGSGSLCILTRVCTAGTNKRWGENEGHSERIRM